MTPDPPQYQPPPSDPALALLTQQAQQQQFASIQDRTSLASARLMQQYGTRVATGGNANWSPLLVPAARGGPGMVGGLVTDPAVGAS